MSGIRPPTRCGLFKPGHTPHWIQMRLATEDAENPPSSGRFVQDRADGTVVIDVDGHEVLLWNHQPTRIAEAARASGGAVTYQPRWGLLWVPSTDGRYAFSVASARDDVERCPATPPVGSPTELLESAGGFSLTLGEIGEITG